MSLRAVILALVAGAIAVLVTHVIGQTFDLVGSFAMWGLGAVAFFAAGIVCGAAYPNASWFLAPTIVGGIALGVIIDAIYQPLVNNQSRNLWPIDIAIWCVISALPILLGFAIGRLIGRTRRPA